LWPGKSTGRPPKADADSQAALIEAVEQNLEKAIIKSVETLNRQKNHLLRLHLQTVQNLLKAG